MNVDNAIVAFARVLRGAGLDVPVRNVLDFTQALAIVGLDDRDGVYWAGRATLVHRPEDIAVYDETFAAFWERRAPSAELATPEIINVTLALDDGTDEPEGTAEARPTEPTIHVRFSATEVLHHKDFADYSPEELDEARALMTTLRLVGARRRSRRQIVSANRRGRPDLRRTVRAALRSGGEPVRRHYTQTGERTRRLVLLLDVSGSMEPYARALVRFVHAAVVGRGRVEAFALGTRLTRITRELSSHDPDRALRNAADAVQDWAGGTRLGDGLRKFNDQWGVRGIARGAVVVILSDGWDRGEPEVMAEQMARLSRVAYRIVWVNPLKSTPGYSPLARGMAAALPFVDDFVEGHSLAAIERLAAVISR